MTDLPEQELADEIDREIADRGGLWALVICLSVAGGLVVAGSMALLGGL